MAERHTHHCLRCDYKWMSKLEHPKRCTSCKSPYWSKTRTRGVVENISKQPGHIVPVAPIDTNNVIIQQRKGFERKHHQKTEAIA